MLIWAKLKLAVPLDFDKVPPVKVTGLLYDVPSTLKFVTVCVVPVNIKLKSPPGDDSVLKVLLPNIVKVKVGAAKSTL